MSKKTSLSVCWSLFRVTLLTLLLIALATHATSAGSIEKVEPLILPDVITTSAVQPPPMRLAESLSLEPVALLHRATEGAIDQLEAMRAHNAAGRLPIQIGFSRPLPEPLRLNLDAEAAAVAAFQRYGGGYLAESLRGGLVWGTHVRSAEAYRLRLHLQDVKLPAGTRMWVWGVGEEPRAFGLELIGPDGDLWTPSVAGEDVFLEIELPEALSQGETFGFEVREVSESFRLKADGSPLTVVPVFEALGECLQDATCFNASTLDVIDAYRKAVAHIQYLKDGSLYVCSGGLLNDTVGETVVPYFLTANHCFATQASASTLEAFWDYRSASCLGAPPNLSSLPRSQGATLLATSANTDFTFLRLNSIPTGRALLGWSAAPIANGTRLHRISHPAPDGFPLHQGYSRALLSTTVGTCPQLPRPQYLYSIHEQGGTFGGSSGSPVILDGGYVVGQLLGVCGPNTADGCDNDNAVVDGAFASTYPSIAGFLSPAVTSPCTPSAETLCIDDQAGDRRFRIQVSYTSAQQSGNGKAIPLSSLGVNSGGLFWFFGASNPELLVKVLNGCGLNKKYWVFWSAGTNVGLTLSVTDTVTGSSKTYTNPNGKAAPPVQDTSALPCS